MSDKPRKPGDRLRVFISYSRRNSTIADVLVEALSQRQCDVTIDRRDLPFGEKWQTELSEFIRKSDTVIWLVSAPSIQSKWVNWELDEVAKRNKRLIPVIVDEVERATLPRQLGEIHILPTEGVFDLARDLDTLAKVLETDHAWLKEASRLSDRAHEWLTKSRNSALMLRGGALASAERWKSAHPAKAPPPSQEVLDLILASRQATTRRQRWWIAGALAVAVGATGLAGAAVWQAKKAEERRQETVKLRMETQRTESGLLSRAAAEVVNTDPATAMLLGLEGMPDTSTDVARPWVSETHLQLDRALRANKELLRLTPGGAVTAVTFSPDGKLLVTASQDYTARLFEAVTGKELRRLDHDGPVSAVSISPDGKLLATASVVWDTRDGYIGRLYEVDTGKELQRLTFRSEILAITFSPDSVLLAIASADNTAGLFEVATGNYLQNLAHDGWVQSVVFSPDGKLLATASNDMTARLFEIATGKELQRFGHEDQVNAVAFSPDGTLLATASTDGTARLFEVATGNQLHSLAQNGRVQSVVFSPDGKFLATGSQENTARLFEVATGRELERIDHGGSVNDVAFSPDGKLLATASDDSTARLFEVATGKELQHFTHDSSVSGIAFSPDGKLLATAPGAGGARLYEASTEQELERIDHGGSVNDLAFSPDGKLLATGSYDNTARLFEVATGRLLERIDHGGSVNDVAFSPDGKLLATASDDSTARLLETATGQELRHLDHNSSVYAVAFAPDGKLLATASDSTTRLFEVETGQELQRFELDYSVTKAVFSPDGKLLATAIHSESEVRLYEVTTGKELEPLHYEQGVGSIAFSPDGKLLAASSGDTIWLYDAATRKELKRLTIYDQVDAIAFSPDGKFLATGHFDNTARLFEVATGHELQRFKHDDSVSSVAFLPDGTVSSVSSVVFSPDGAVLMTGSNDKSARLWPVFRTGQELVNATKAKATGCLTQVQRRQYFLPPTPPFWCVERRLWPYHTNAWLEWLDKQKAWIAADRAGDAPPLPVDNDQLIVPERSEDPTILQEALNPSNEVDAPPLPMDNDQLTVPERGKDPTILQEPLNFANRRLVVVPDLVTAPGDGQVSLANAVRKQLARQGYEVVEHPTVGAFTVHGAVYVGLSDAGIQKITIDWSVYDPAGTFLGKAVQSPLIPPGSLDLAWGPTADAAAKGAVPKIIEIIQNGEPAAPL